ncbi:SIR2 family NAD-dependent protein deacylase [Pseudoduganella namucuonensis]|uniref:protein acetyllysine N-acetyltransferase n=1 Tax=Pseudoduganella namucuonensis TaxID=1035707 RepID=A0A1I7IY57_9BURK|nr:Sir2 family NAD-dependent protein deacetylase [Pseudoduganella namucuonensis]SFU77870.1 NAD-dependent protein deacetylase, SIR2 family [Pseudoduganella namucuonensis]
MTIEQAADLIAQADSLIIAAGAGMGVDSGLPDFRGNAGFWKAYPALARARLEFTSVASPQTFRVDPSLAWGFYGHRLRLYRDTRPHAGFDLLRAWGGRMEHGYSVFTSNVDGQFQLAGFDPQRIVECHGSIHHLQCMAACDGDIWSADRFQPDVDAAACRLRNAPPACPHCGKLARPNILMFGDWDWLERRSEAQAARQQAWLAGVRRPVVVELGAGTAIPSVRHFSHGIVQRHGGRLIRINPREPEVPGPRDVGLAMGALEGLSAIAARLAKRA